MAVAWLGGSFCFILPVMMQRLVGPRIIPRFLHSSRSCSIKGQCHENL